MNTVTFGTLNSYDDLNLILSSKTIGSPSPKVNILEVPDSDKVLDFSEFSGEIHYSQRQLKFTFTAIDPYMEDDATIKNALHGRRMNITLDDIEGYYFTGRLSVGDWQINKKLATVEITADCDPWKYKTYETIITAANGTATLANARKPVVPKITTSGAATISWTGGSASLSAGTDLIVPELVVPAGNTAITITGDATVSFKYREAVL